MATGIAVVALAAVLVAQEPVERAAGAAAAVSGLDGNLPPTPPVPLSGCPWLAAEVAQGESPTALAASVVDQMTLQEKLGELALRSWGPYENVDAGVPRLCIPSLTLQDGPAGLAFGDTGVTALPAPLAVAATFDPSVARAVGSVLGSQARGQGIDVVQGPDLNLFRVPQSGRGFEGFGEDPALTSALGVATVEGIQQTGTMADAKHLVAYSQETGRRTLDAVVGSRALHELYLAPFQAAVSQAHVASVMCAYPRLNGTYQCEDPALESQLEAWGFSGFVRSDLGAVHDPAAAVTAGTALIKPVTVATLAAAVDRGTLKVDAVNRDVTRLLAQMFAYGLVGRTPSGTPGTPVATAADTSVALQAAERSMVLLRDQGGVLPLDPAGGTIAVIGSDATGSAVTAGGGSSRVTGPKGPSPLEAIRQRVAPGTRIVTAGGGSAVGALPAVPGALLTPATGSGHGLTLTITGTGPAGGRVLDQALDPVASASVHPTAASPSPLGDVVGGLPTRPHGGPRSLPGGASSVQLPASWGPVQLTWTGTLTPTRSGLTSFSLWANGTATLTLDGKSVLSAADTANTWPEAVNVEAGHRYQLRLTWTPPAGGARAGSLSLGMASDTQALAQAAQVAARSTVAVVFAGAPSSEGADRPSLSLPGAQDALIEAVAAANPNTVVVLNTGGPVLMPWLDQVAGVIEAWYPGQAAGRATAAVLFGDVNPAGHLPVTFPASVASSATPSAAQWPGVQLASSAPGSLTSTYSEGLDVGYRFDHATGTRPLFPFGFGLSYTSFTLHDLSVTATGDGGQLVHVQVTDTGSRSGTAVVQAYLTFPAAAGEPPGQLVAFAPVAVGPGATATAALTVPASAFRIFGTGGWTTVPGTYSLTVGQSSADPGLTTTVTVP